MDADDIGVVLPMPECIEAITRALKASSSIPVRSFVGGVAAAHGKFHIKSALQEGEHPLFVAKINANFPGNPARGMPTIQGILALFNAADGRLLALMDSGALTAIRTAAATGVAASFLAPADASTLAIIGCGAQALHHVQAICAVRPITAVRPFDLDPAASRAFAGAVTKECGLQVELCDDLRAATATADIIVTLTSSARAFLGAGDVRPGAFVAGVGTDNPDKSELHPELLAGARIIVDDLEQCAAMGDLHHAIASGLVAAADVAGTLADVVADPARFPPGGAQVTVFDSTGIPIEDAAAAALAFEGAERLGIGLRG